ncbi:UPF0142 protein [Salmonella enterica subsp. enterica]|uniref:UPF0142 protein n=1 Tax=Salmonella enterica I TaxID=59201 RepID=A0A3S4F6B0_SALET|nr:UPF0142 protein [Salmonella enterica subsp. enterica]
MPNVWSVHIRDKECALCFTNGKGATKKAALASALGEYFERLSTNYFFADFWLGETVANGPFVHYPNEKWFPLTENDDVPEGLLDARLRAFYDPENELTGSQLIDLQSGNEERGVCGLPFTRQSDNQTVYIPMNIIGNLYVSNGMSAGNTRNEARVQGLSEVFERYVKNRIIAESISLPEIPAEVMARYPAVMESIATLEAEGFPIFAYDGSLGGKYPVICVVLFNPANGTCFASFGAHPDFGVALERTVTELLQGRGLKDLDVFTPPTFDDEEVAEHTNLETHFIDSKRPDFLGSVQTGRRLPVHGLEFFRHYRRRIRHADGHLLLLKIKKFTLPITSISAYTPVVLSYRECLIFILPKICGWPTTIWVAIFVRFCFRCPVAPGIKKTISI